MPLGAARLNTLSKVLTVAADTSRTTGFVDVTTTGDTQLSNAQYKFNTGTRGGSILFDGSGDYMECDTSFNLGTGDFTMETYFRSASESVFHIIFDHRDTTSDDAVTLVVHNNAQGGNSLTPYLFVNNTKQIIGTTTLNSGAWHHLAVVRSSGVFTLYVDGTSEGGTYANSNSFTTTNTMRIGANRLTSTAPVNGYLDEIRISDTARFTSNFTPDSSAYGSDSNTLLLLHGDGPYGSNGNRHIVDDIGDLRPLDIYIEQNVTVNSGSAASISTAQSKFGGSSLRMNDNNSHCQYVSPEWGSAFTIEFWFRADGLSGDQFMAGVWGGSPHGGFNWSVYLNGSTVKAYVWNGSYQLNNATVGTASSNTWHHFALTWDGSTYRTFLDGTMGGTASSSTAPAFDQWQVTWVGTVGGTTSTFAGYIDEYRQSDTARYTASFTPSTSAFISDANTKVLLHFDGTNGDTTTTDDINIRLAAVVDSVFGGELDTAQKQFGTASWYQDAEYDGLKISDETPFDHVNASTAFTIEMWVRRQTNPTSNTCYLYDQSQCGFFYDETANRLKYETEGVTRITSTSSLSTNTWYHVALVRDTSNNTKLYIDGSQSGSTFTSDDRDWINHQSGAQEHLFGVSRSGTDSWVGHIDEIRISDTQRYTGSFTVPASAFTNDDDTLCLFHFDGADGSTTVTDDAQ
jgi:hypothetical protein